MTRHRIDPLRIVTDEEREVLTQISCAASEPASHVARAKSLLAVANGKNYTEAAHAAGARPANPELSRRYRSDAAISHIRAEIAALAMRQAPCGLVNPLAMTSAE